MNVPFLNAVSFPFAENLNQNLFSLGKVFLWPFKRREIVYIHTNTQPLKTEINIASTPLSVIVQSITTVERVVLRTTPFFERVNFLSPTQTSPEWTRLSCTIRRCLLPPALPLCLLLLLRCFLCPFSCLAFPEPPDGKGACVWCVDAGCCAPQSACGKAGIGRASPRCAPFGGAGAHLLPWSA